MHIIYVIANLSADREKLKNKLLKIWHIRLMGDKLAKTTNTSETRNKKRGCRLQKEMDFFHYSFIMASL